MKRFIGDIAHMRVVQLWWCVLLGIWIGAGLICSGFGLFLGPGLIFFVIAFIQAIPCGYFMNYAANHWASKP